MAEALHLRRTVPPVRDILLHRQHILLLVLPTVLRLHSTLRAATVTLQALQITVRARLVEMLPARTVPPLRGILQVLQIMLVPEHRILPAPRTIHQMRFPERAAQILHLHILRLLLRTVLLLPHQNTRLDRKRTRRRLPTAHHRPNMTRMSKKNTTSSNRSILP